VSLKAQTLLKLSREKIVEVRENLRIAQSRQKSYADRRRRELKFDVGDHAYLKVSPIHGTRRFRVRGKLAPWYIAPYPVIKRIGVVAYKIKLPEQLSFMCLNYGNASECQKSKWYPTPWTYKMICDIRRYPCKSWTL
jgi:hypothetical protein